MVAKHITSRNFTLITALTLFAASVTVIVKANDLLEMSSIASEKFVGLAVEDAIKVPHSRYEAQFMIVAGQVDSIQKQQLQTSETVLSSIIVNVKLKLLEMNLRLREDPANTDLNELKRITETSLTEMQQQLQLVKCDQLKIERPDASCR